jgi:ACS family tartrate transporter-like MFS transporter
VVASTLLAAFGYLVAAMGHSDLVVIIGFCLASSGVYAALATFWTVPPIFLGGTAAAGAFALINSFGNLSGFLGPAIMGWLKQHTGDYRSGLFVCVAVLVASAVIMAALGRGIGSADA